MWKTGEELAEITKEACDNVVARMLDTYNASIKKALEEIARNIESIETEIEEL